MKKIMFNDKYGLTEAVLQGRKTMTRRIVTGMDNLEEGNFCYMKPPYKIGDVVAVAQSYSTLANSGIKQLAKMITVKSLSFKKEYCGAGLNNKMFVKPDLMPHRIRITDRKIERLQDISKSDCIMEGISEVITNCRSYNFKDQSGKIYSYPSPRDAFAALIDKVSGRGTWDSNPWVFAYSFEIIK